MKSFFLLLICTCVLAIPLRIPQKPLISGHQVDWKKADCFSSSSENGTNTICIQQVFNPVFDSEILPTPVANQFAGYMSVGQGPAPPVQLFFWVVMSERDPKNDPVVLWMNGGPGSTSLYGLFDQWGPYLIDHTKSPSVVFKRNDNRLTEKLTWVFLEQPSGTGFSTGGPLIMDSETAAKDVSSFITALFQKTTTFKMPDGELSLNGRDFHIAGESFAGHWIPAIGSYMIQIKQHTAVNLKSILLGNSLIDASLKGVAMEKLVCGSSAPLKLPGANQGDVDDRCKKMPTWKKNCDPAIVNCVNHPNNVNCDAAWKACGQSWGEGWAARFDKNVYDASKDKKSQTDSKDFFDKQVAGFLNNADRRTRLGVSSGPEWHPGSTDMMRRFWDSGDMVKSYIPKLEDILKANIDFLLYAVSGLLRDEHG